MNNIFKKYKLVVITMLILILCIFCIWQNNSIQVTKTVFSNENVPKSFDGFKIAHISDLHNKKFGKEQNKILAILDSTEPNIIVITGDLVDRRRYNLDIAMDFINGAVKIAPVYYVPGNHEAWSGKYTEIKESLTLEGANVLEDGHEMIELGEDNIKIIGVKDPDFLTQDYIEGTNTSSVVETLKKYDGDESFKILLSHRPELINVYSKYNMNLVFSGHAHGGQVRLPFIGGLIAPDQGFFPKYTEGEIKSGNTTMYVSRGLGNSIIPIRVFNRPEIVLVTIKN